MQSAVFSAHEIFQAGVWSRAPASERAMVLSNLARDLEERVPELAKVETAQTGRAVREMKAQVRSLLNFSCRVCVQMLTSTSGSLDDCQSGCESTLHPNEVCRS